MLGISAMRSWNNYPTTINLPIHTATDSLQLWWLMGSISRWKARSMGIACCGVLTTLNTTFLFSSPLQLKTTTPGHDISHTFVSSPIIQRFWSVMTMLQSRWQPDLDFLKWGYKHASIISRRDWEEISEHAPIRHMLRLCAELKVFLIPVPSNHHTPILYDCRHYGVTFITIPCVLKWWQRYSDIRQNFVPMKVSNKRPWQPTS